MRLLKSAFQPTLDFVSTVFLETDFVEMRIMMQDKTIWSGCFTDLEVMSMQAAYFEERWKPKATYYTLNPINPKFASQVGPVDEPNRMGCRCRSTRDSYILHRNLLLVDIDPVRPTDVCATTAERTSAQELSIRVREYLHAHHFVSPIVLDSGNGVALLYPTEAHAAASGEWNTVLGHLAETFDNDHAKIDVSVKNASRVSRLPGTMNRKGVNTADRSHRQCTVTEMPANFTRMRCDVVADMAAKHAPTVAVKTNHKAKAVQPSDKRSVSLPSPRVKSKNGFRFLLTRETLLQIISEFPDMLKLDRVTNEGETAYFALSSCPFVGRPHTNQDGGRGKTAIILRPDNVGFKCFSGGCDGRTFSDLVRLIEKQYGRRSSVKIWERIEAEPHPASFTIDVGPHEEPLEGIRPESDHNVLALEGAQGSGILDGADLGVASPKILREIYLSEAWASANSVEFVEHAPKPTLANYPVQPYLLFQAFLDKVDRILLGRFDDVVYTDDTVHFLCEQSWRQTFFHPKYWTPHEVAAFVGPQELHYLLSLHVAQVWFPSKGDVRWCSIRGGHDDEFDNWFDGDKSVWPHLCPELPVSTVKGYSEPTLDAMCKARDPEDIAASKRHSQQCRAIEQAARENLCPPPPEPPVQSQCMPLAELTPVPISICFQAFAAAVL